MKKAHTLVFIAHQLNCNMKKVSGQKGYLSQWVKNTQGHYISLQNLKNDKLIKFSSCLQLSLSIYIVSLTNYMAG